MLYDPASPPYHLSLSLHPSLPPPRPRSSRTHRTPPIVAALSQGIAKLNHPTPVSLTHTHARTHTHAPPPHTRTHTRTHRQIVVALYQGIAKLKAAEDKA
jgi:hypothetical protein